MQIGLFRGKKSKKRVAKDELEVYVDEDADCNELHDETADAGYRGCGRSSGPSAFLFGPCPAPRHCKELYRPPSTVTRSSAGDEAA